MTNPVLEAVRVELRAFGRWIDRGHDFYPLQVTRWTAIYPCHNCDARFPTLRRCSGEHGKAEEA